MGRCDLWIAISFRGNTQYGAKLGEIKRGWQRSKSGRRRSKKNFEQNSRLLQRPSSACQENFFQLLQPGVQQPLLCPIKFHLNFVADTWPSLDGPTWGNPLCLMRYWVSNFPSSRQNHKPLANLLSVF